ncbi:MAG TPA: Ig domain-containing protein, partial [Polyangiaceae bacterium]
MSYKYWLLFGSLALAAAQTVACSSEFSSCQAKRTCPAGGAAGASGMAGAPDAGAGAATDDGEAGAAEGGSAGHHAQGSEAGSGDDAGSGGVAGEASIETELTILLPTLTIGKTYVPYTGKISASGASQYTWSITKGTLPAGLALQGTQSASVTIAGTPTEAGQFPISLSVTDGSITKAVDVTLVVTHLALFLSDRRLAGVNELYVTEIGSGEAGAPVQLSASLPSGGSVS